MKDLITIRCPICNTEYLPSEVFMPDSIFGKQKEIVKNADGSINFYVGDDPDYDEEFICDTCMSKLKVHANISFTAEVANNTDEFEEEYSVKIDKPKKIKLSEANIFE